MSCNPCNSCPVNSASNETLESSLQNFSEQFFGKVQATSINGERSIILPCDLNSALPANPRGDTEGLACYFQRLFQNGIDGTLGPKGDPGVAGIPGRPNYAVLTSGFSVPTILSTPVTFSVIPTLVISEGQLVFIPTAGWFLITSIVNLTTVTALLCGLVAIPASFVPAGTKIEPVGPKGDSITGATGAKGPKGDVGNVGPVGGTLGAGPQGPQGLAATLATGTNQYVCPDSVAFSEIPTSLGVISFVPAAVNIYTLTLTGPGIYLVRALVGIQNKTNNDQDLSFGLYSSAISDLIDWTENSFSLTANQYGQAFLDAIINLETATSTVIEVYGSKSANHSVHALGPNCSLLSVKLR